MLVSLEISLGWTLYAMHTYGIPVVQTVKMGVQYSLWGGSILNLGTEKHKKAYFEDIDKFRLPGECLYSFAQQGMQLCQQKISRTYRAILSTWNAFDMPC